MYPRHWQGLEALWISDHFHPWLDEQGQSGFVWSLIGAISQVTSLPITTAVTCPLLRQHPAIVAQAAATSALLTGGRFTLGAGTGEALNEHILGRRWPSAEERLEMLEEAVQVIRELLTGQLITHEGKHYTVDTARLYSVPDRPPPVFMSGFGEKAIKVAARIADGYITTMPNAGFVRLYRESGGGDRPVQGGLKVCWSPDEARARKTVHRLWATDAEPVYFRGLQQAVRELLACINQAQDKRAPLIVCCDFNADPDSDEIRMLKGRTIAPASGLSFKRTSATDREEMPG